MVMQRVRQGKGEYRSPGADWSEAGACRDEDPDLFFPITSKGPSARQVLAAKAVCARCLVRRDCLNFALESRQDHGVWGGTSEDDRRLMRRARSRERRQAAHDHVAAASLRGGPPVRVTALPRCAGGP